MKLNYKQLGEFIEPVNQLNEGLEVKELLGISNQKFFQNSHTNTIDIDLQTYRIVRTNQFAYNRATTRNGDKISIALLQGNDCIVSPSYRIFRSKDEDQLNSEYLMMWFRRPEFDRYARFKSHGSAHEFFEYEQMCQVELPIPSITKQREIVKEYNVIQNRIRLNQQLIQKLEETAQAVYREWFVEGEFDKMTLLKDYVETNPKLELKKGSISTYIEMANLSETSMSINGKIEREYQGGSRFQNYDTLLARITPCLENGKTAFVNILNENEVAAGSTEFIVMRPKNNISPFWIYCLAKDESFRSFAISSMIGSSGRQRVHEKYLDEYQLPVINDRKMAVFHKTAKPIFETVKLKSIENQKLTELKELLLSRLARVGE
jgi:type I restriction enzyme, S subunit